MEHNQRSVPMPKNDLPFWLSLGHPLSNHQSASELPKEADVVIIGAGLTGSAAAYFLTMKNRGQMNVVVLDQGDPACEASGRNGGSFEAVSENAMGFYDGIVTERYHFLRQLADQNAKARPTSDERKPTNNNNKRGKSDKRLWALARRQAACILDVAQRNRKLLTGIVRRERIDCDFSPRGWLFLAQNAQEQRAIRDEVAFIRAHGQQVEIWPPKRIRQALGFRAAWDGRFMPRSGSYHPFKLVCGMLRCALRRGAQLYTRTHVQHLKSLSDTRHQVVTARGVILARRVIVATNAFTSGLLPELAAIQPRQSQIMVTAHPANKTRGCIVTSEQGPVYFHDHTHPHHGTFLLMGGGDDYPVCDPYSRRRSAHTHQLLLRLRDRYFPELKGAQVSSEWVGSMGFTPEQLPAIGVLRPGVAVAAGFCGYGGVWCLAAAQAVVQAVRQGKTPKWMPADIFSPRRLLGQAASAPLPCVCRPVGAMWSQSAARQK